jgi:hypothetical protein
MARSAPAFSSFTAGEISPRMEGRVTLDTYREGLADMTNLLVMPQGGVTRRPGTEFLGEIKDSSKAARLIPFQFKTSDTYILEFGDQVMRVYRNGAQVLDASVKTITGITQASPGVITSNSHGLSNGDEIFIDAIVGMTELNGRNYRVAGATTNTFTLVDLFGNAINTTGFTAYASGGTATEIYNIATPYAVADLPALRYVQSADTMYIVHPSYDVRKLTRTADNAWAFVIPIFQGPLLAAKTVEDITQANPGVVTVTGHGFSNGDQIQLNNIKGMVELEELNFRVANVTTNTFTLQDEAGTNIDTTAFTAFVDGGGDSGTITGATAANPVVITATAHPFFDGDIIYISGVVGMTELNGNYYKVSAATTNTFALQTVAGVDVDGSGFTAYTSDGTAEIGASKVQEIGPVSTALSGTNDRPSVVSFFEQRLVFGNTNNNPQTLWFSKNGDYQNFTTGTADDDALIYTIASNQVNAIRYLSATRVLTIGTTGGEYVLTATSDGPVTPTTTLIRKYSNYGSAAVEPVQVADVTLFVQRGGRKVREFRYVGDINVSAYQAPDITIVAEHITAGGLTAFAYQQEPDGVIWAIRADGTLLGVTYRREEEVVAWHKHVIGGTFSGGQAVVESIATLPSDTGEDELYLIVKRTINGVTKRYVEFMRPFNFGGVTTGAYFVDCGLRYSGTATTTLSGLYHLPGETVAVLANGSSHPDRTVSGGGVSLAYSSTTAAVGYGYTSSMQTMRIEAGSADGTSQGKPKRIHAITLRLLETVGIEVGNSSVENDRIFFRDSSMPMDQAVPLFTGDKDIEFPGGYNDDDRLYVRQDQPLPMSVLALFPRMNTFDK